MIAADADLICTFVRHSDLSMRDLLIQIETLEAEAVELSSSLGSLVMWVDTFAQPVVRDRRDLHDVLARDLVRARHLVKRKAFE